MPTVFDVAAYILQQRGTMTTWKLQKLVYYSQAWSLVWDDNALFPEEIQAWDNGPVVPVLYAEHRGKFRVSGLDKGDPSALNSVQKETVDAVLRDYGNKTSQWLSDLTHAEGPWKNARKSLIRSPRITEKSLFSYYSISEPNDYPFISDLSGSPNTETQEALNRIGTEEGCTYYENVNDLMQALCE